MLKVPHFGCMSHNKLNLDVEQMVKTDSSLPNTIEEVNGTMLLSKRKLKNAALLHNLTIPKQTITKKTRWSSMQMMLANWRRIRDKVKEVAEHDDSVELEVNTDKSFFKSVDKYHKQLCGIDSVTKF